MTHPSYRCPPGTVIANNKIEAFFAQPELGLQPVENAPTLTTAHSSSLREIETIDELRNSRLLYVPEERALTIVIDGRELVTLMTLGAAPELLVLGFLFNQRLIGRAADIESIAVHWESNTAAVQSRHTAEGGPAMLRNVAGASGQGSIFAARKLQLDSIRLPGPHEARITQGMLYSLIDIMRQHDGIHRNARSVHSCALFSAAGFMVSVEDVGRHNGLDTISGWMLLFGVQGANKFLFTTGRLTGEIVTKAAQCGIPIVVSRNGVSAMGYDIARKLGMALFGRAINRRFVCYTGYERFDEQSD